MKTQSVFLMSYFWSEHKIKSSKNKASLVVVFINNNDVNLFFFHFLVLHSQLHDKWTNNTMFISVSQTLTVRLLIAHCSQRDICNVRKIHCVLSEKSSESKEISCRRLETEMMTGKFNNSELILKQAMQPGTMSSSAIIFPDDSGRLREAESQTKNTHTPQHGDVSG